MFPGQIACVPLPTGSTCIHHLLYNVNKYSSVFILLARSYASQLLLYCEANQKKKKLKNNYCKMKEIGIEKRELI